MVNKKRITAKQHALHGNPSKISNFEGLIDATPEPVKISPDIPETILNKPYALEMWGIIETELRNRDEYSKTYGGLIESACISWNNYKEANFFIDKHRGEGKAAIYLCGDKMLPLPFYKMARESYQDYLKAMQEMALTPISATQKGFNKKDDLSEIAKLLQPKNHG